VKRNYSCQQQPWVDNIVSISNVDNLTCISQKMISNLSLTNAVKNLKG
jgi:hypothetical protein